MSTADLIHTAKTAGSDFVASRATAKDGRGIRAIRILEEKLVEALRISGTGLRGLPNLNTRGDFFAGLNVRGNPSAQLQDYRPRLVLATDGRLVLATKTGDAVELIRATDEDLVVEDLDLLCERIITAIRTHTYKCVDATRRNNHLSALASRIETTLAA